MELENVKINIEVIFIFPGELRGIQHLIFLWDDIGLAVQELIIDFFPLYRPSFI